MNRSDFRIKEYRGKFYIERKLETPKLKNAGEIKVFGIGVGFSKWESVTVITWERVDDYGNHVTIGETIKELRRYLDRRLDYFKTLQKAKNKVEEFFQEPKYYYLK